MVSQHNDSHYQDLEDRFLEIFSYRWCWIEHPHDQNWRTVKGYKLKDAVLLDKWRDSNQFIGLGFSKTTTYACLDIDRGSPYHPYNGGNLSEILQPLEAIGIVRSLVLRSSDSEGLHIYLALPEAVPTFKLACLLKETLQKANLTVKDGWLEIFPNKKAHGRGGEYIDYKCLRLPLQNGSRLLDENLIPYSSDLGVFLNKWDLVASYQDIELLKKEIEKVEYDCYQANTLYTGDATKWRQELELSIERGFTGDSQTNELLKICLKQGVVFLGKTGHDLSQWMYNTIRSMPGFNEFCGHKADLHKRVAEYVKWNERSQAYTPYRSHPERNNLSQQFRELEAQLNPTNEDRKNSTVERIKAVINSLKGKYYSTKRALLDAIQSKLKEIFGVGCSIRSLYKNADLWEPLLRSVTVQPEPEPEPLPTPPNSFEMAETPIERTVTHPPLYEGFCSRSKNSSEILYPAPQPELPELPPLPSRLVTWEERKVGIVAEASKLAERLRRKFTAGNSESQSEPENFPQSDPQSEPEKISQPVPEKIPQSEPENSEILPIGATVIHRIHGWYGQLVKTSEDYHWIEWRCGRGAIKTEAWLVAPAPE